MSLLHDSTPTVSSLQRFGFSSSASPEADEKDAAKKSENASTASEQDEVSGKKNPSASDQEEESGSVSIALVRYSKSYE